MIRIYKEDKKLILEYESEYPNVNWIFRKFNNNEPVLLQKTFHLLEQDLISNINVDERDDEIYSVKFLLGTLDGEYHKINKDILDISYDLQIHKSTNIDKKMFINRKTSIFSVIDSLINEKIIIGGKEKNAIAFEEFQKIVKSLPTDTEIMHYENARITNVLKNYFDTAEDSQIKLEKYLKKKENLFFKKPITEILKTYEHRKYIYLHDMLSEMLKNKGILEKDWQNQILEIIRLLYPQYIKVLSNVHIKDYYSKSKTTNRYIDLMLMNDNGYIDIIEIKRPFENNVLSARDYRGKYIPHKELAGAIMQAEKYIFHLNKWGHTGEKFLNKKYASSLPKNMSLKIANPKSIIILGRSNAFTEKQKLDFEIIKKKYHNLIDILTYDDLLIRLKNIIDSFNDS